MEDFKVGDELELAIEAEIFQRFASSNNSTPEYITHFKKGKSAKVVQKEKSSVRFKAEEIARSSNWFEKEWFQRTSELSKIKRESQRF